MCASQPTNVSVNAPHPSRDVRLPGVSHRAVSWPDRAGRIERLQTAEATFD